VQGFYILVDFHAAPGDTTVSSGSLVADWRALWQAISSRPAFARAMAGRIFLDLINEPDGIGLRLAVVQA
jgi:aryl-phospho-beta-D-glucosidase BglC (GH1 family)